MFKNAMVLIVLSALIGSFTPSFAKHAIEGLGPFTLLLLRFVTATAVMWFIIPKQERGYGYFKKLGLTGLFGAGNPLLFFVALLTIPASIVPLFFATSPTWTALHARFFAHRIISARQVFGIATGLLGVSLLTFSTFESNTDMQWWGIALLSLAVLSFTAYAIRSEKHQKVDKVAPTTLVYYFSLVGGLVALPFATGEIIIGEAFDSGLDLSHLLAALYTGVIGTGLGFSLYQLAIKQSNALTVSVFFYIQPVFAVLVAVILLDEKFTLLSVIGGVAVLLGAQFAKLSNSK